MGKFSVWLGGLLFLSACQPPPGQTPVVKPSVVSPSPIVSPSTSGSPVPTSSLTPVESPSPTPSFSSRPVEVVAGTGAKGFQDGAAKQAIFSSLQGACYNPQNRDLYILDSNKVRKLSFDGQVSTVAGSDAPGFKDGALNEAKFNYPQDCVVDEQGQLLIADYGNHRIRLLSLQKGVSTLLGTGEALSKDGIVAKAGLALPQNLALSSDGKLYFSERSKIRLFANGEVITLNKHQGNVRTDRFTYKDGPISTDALIGENLYLTVAPNDELFFTDLSVKALRKLDSKGNVTTISRQNFENDFTYLVQPQDLVYSIKTDEWFIQDIATLYSVKQNGDVKMLPIQNLGNINTPQPFTKIVSIVLGSLNTNETIYILDSGTNQIKIMKN